MAVVGAGHSLFGTWKGDTRSLFAEALKEAFGSVDKGLYPGFIEEAFIGSLGFGGGQLGNLGAYVLDGTPLRGIPTRRVENACASSGFAFRDAYLAIRSGARSLVLAGGIERMNDLSPTRQRFWLGVSGDTEWERLAGLTFPGVYALMARRHMHEFGTTREQLAEVAVKNHSYGAYNKKAQFQKAVTPEQVLGAPMVADPFTRYHCCSTTDGAAAVILASEERAKEFTDDPIWVRGSGAASDYLSLADRESLTELLATKKAAKDAFRDAGIEIGKVNFAEVHDCFTIAEILALEDLGFCRKGEGGKVTASGETRIGGKLAVNPSGGLKAKGHPLGATGAAQIYEVFQQFRGRVEKERQVPDPSWALTHNVGGSGATCAIHIFSRETP